MPIKKINQAEPLLDDSPEKAGTELAERPAGPMARRILSQLEALDPAPFREVLRDILLSFKGTRWKGLDPDKRVKAARELAQLAGFASPAISLTTNVLHVERMSDAEIMSELGKARAALASVMSGDARVIDGETGMAGEVSANGGTGGLGAPVAGRVDTQGPLPAEKNPVGDNASVIFGQPARPPESPVAPSGGEATPAKPPVSSMVAKIEALRAAGKLSPAPLAVKAAKLPSAQPGGRAKQVPASSETRSGARKSSAPAAGAKRPQGRKGEK